MIHQPAADDDDTGIQRHHQIGDVQTHDACLKVEDFQRQRVALLGAGAEGQDLFLDGRGRFGELVIGMTLDEFRE